MLKNVEIWLGNPSLEILNLFLTPESCKSAKNSWGYKPLKFKPPNGIFGKKSHMVQIQSIVDYF